MSKTTDVLLIGGIAAAGGYYYLKTRKVEIEIGRRVKCTFTVTNTSEEAFGEALGMKFLLGIRATTSSPWYWTFLPNKWWGSQAYTDWEYDSEQTVISDFLSPGESQVLEALSPPIPYDWSGRSIGLRLLGDLLGQDNEVEVWQSDGEPVKVA